MSYQVNRDLKMMSDNPNILLFYEELVKQFGYIVIFSGIFPLAALLSIISNQIQVKSQINNLKYLRRFRAEASFGIGNWLNNLENLCIGGIIINCYVTYFTSSTYQKLFVTVEDPHHKVEGMTALDYKSGLKIIQGWDELDFFYFIVLVEHSALLLKLILQKFIDDVPEKIQ